jgi:hypothetical protein
MSNIAEQHVKDFYRYANRIARNHRYWKANIIVRGNEDKVVSRVKNGYRKYTTGEYVAKAYLRNFGWKNTYYQPAITVVMVQG